MEYNGNERETDLLRFVLSVAIVFFALVAVNNIVFAEKIPEQGDIFDIEPDGSKVEEIKNDPETDEPPPPPDSENEPHGDDTPDTPPEPDNSDGNGDDEPGEVEPGEDEPQNEDAPNTTEEPPFPERSEKLEDIIRQTVETAVGELGEVKINSKGYTKYAGNFDAGQKKWAAEFLAWCIGATANALGDKYAQNFYPWSDTVSDCEIWFIGHDRFEDPDSDYIPRVGDYVFFDFDKVGGADHVAMVTSVLVIKEGRLKNEKGASVIIEVIEGNAPDQGFPNAVTMRYFEKENEDIYGYGRICD